MQSVLDGEAAAEQERQLMELIAADPQARSEFDRLRALFDDLGRLPEREPPADLSHAVMAALQARQARKMGGLAQLSAGSRVIDPKARGWASRIANLLRQALLPEPTWSGVPMNKIWIGGAVAAIAVVGVAQFGLGGKTSEKDTMGTIMPAERYRAPQTTGADVVGTSSGGGAAAPQPGRDAGLGKDALGKDAMGKDTMGKDAMGKDAMGKDALGKDALGKDAMGKDALGKDAMGKDALGKDAMGKDAMGKDAMGKDAMGKDAMGKDAMGKDAMGKDAMGKDAMGKNVTR